MKENIVAFIGAGSPTATVQVVGDICRRPELSGATLVFQDKDQSRADLMRDVCQLFADQIGANVTIRTVPTIEDAVANAGFVINAALNGGWGLNSRIRKRIQEETGINKPVEAQAYTSQLGFLLAVAREIEKTKTDAVLIQMANPIAEGGTLIHRETNVNFIGVCHGYRKLDQALTLMGMNPLEAEPTMAGINHNMWLLELLYRNEDAYPRLWEWIHGVSESYADYIRAHLGGGDYQISPAAIAICKYFELFPVGDTTRASQPHMYSWHRSEDTEENLYGKRRGRDSRDGFREKMSEREGILSRIEKACEDGDVLASGIFPKGFSEWQVASIISAMTTGNSTHEVVNIPNKGAIADLPDDVIVEVPAEVDADGARAAGIFRFPERVLTEAILPHWRQVENHVGAYRGHDLMPLFNQLLANEPVKSPEIALAILRIWAEEDQYMAEHYNLQNVSRKSTGL